MLLGFLSSTEHWILAGVLFFFFAFFAGVNLIFLPGKIASRFEHGPSFAPFFGGLFGLMGILLMPVGELSDRLPWLWVPLVLDVSCIPMVIFALYFRTKK